MSATNKKSMHYSTAVRRAVLTALGAAAVGTCLPMTTAIAQEADDSEYIEEIVTTGTILRRTDTAPSPITIMTDEYMELRGINTISQAMQRMSANNAGTIVDNWNVGWNFATGATAPALRGLTVQSTLSMADGLRLAPYPLADDGQRNFVDLNTIPNAIVDRIEVLRDGASSTYGADAIAGVVNIITKKEVQGFHLGVSTGFAEQGAAEENSIDMTWGTGDLGNDGYNFYVSAEWQDMGNMVMNDRSFPFNTGDWQSICGPSGSCLPNHNWNSITSEIAPGATEGSYNGFVSIPGVALVRPVLLATDIAGTGRYEYLNPAAGCRNWPEVTITPTMSAVSPLTSCEVDYRNAFLGLQPDIQRKGISLRFTANLSDDSQFYAMANFYRTDTSGSQVTPLGFRGRPTNPRGSFTANYNVLLPVYVCSAGAGAIGTFDGLNTGCDATNGILNPNNPYAALGQRAQVELRNTKGRASEGTSRVQRFAAGLDGVFGNDWRYSTAATFSEVSLERTNRNYFIPQRIMDVVAQGTFDFFDPEANSQEIWDFITPPKTVTSPSRLWMIEGNIAKDLAELGGGPLQAAVGVSFRDESIIAPSANPAQDSAPAERYYSLNAVGTDGARDVTSVYFEIDAPFTEMIDVIASGRYDDYSTGQNSFSPKLGFKLSPTDRLALRGTWSEGFRIPSFNEAFGLPRTGFVTRTVDCLQFADFCNSHNNNAYATTSYSLGLTNTGDPTLESEESTSFTAGIIWGVTENFNVTLDYWEIEIDQLITGVTDTSPAEAQYYSNNGVVDIPGTIVVAGLPDPAFPNALPLIGEIEQSFQNQDSQKVSGIDVNATWSGIQLGRVDWTTSLDVSFLQEYTLTTDAGDKLEYEGTLSPCNITSCSGAPEVRGSWQNTFVFNDDRTTASLTIYFTSGLDTASIDFGGVKGDCQGNADIGASTNAFVDGTPAFCQQDDQWNTDLTVSHQWTDQVRVFVDILNVFDTDPEFQPEGAYGLYGFNPAWASPNIVGRYFRVGAKFDFE